MQRRAQHQALKQEACLSGIVLPKSASKLGALFVLSVGMLVVAASEGNLRRVVVYSTYTSILMQDITQAASRDVYRRRQLDMTDNVTYYGSSQKGCPAVG